MKLVSTLVICTSLVITPASAQVAPYNPAVRAAPPTFKIMPPVTPAEEEAAAKARGMKAAAAVLVLGWLIWLATKDRPNPSDDRPVWASEPKETTIWLPKDQPKYEPPPAPAPAISPFYQ